MARHATTDIHRVLPWSRLAYAGLAATLATAVVGMARAHGGGGLALTLALAPDVAFLYGAAPGLAQGQIHSRAVRLYNAVHAFPCPLLLAFAGAFGWFGLGPQWAVAALAWAAHIAVDRALGMGLRDPEGFQRD